MLAILDQYLGHLAGISTSILWVATSLFFTAGGKRLGPTAVNALRIALAVIFLGLTHRLLSHQWIPDLSGRQAALLAASGFIGLSIGDGALFRAFVDIGPRLSILIMTTSPLFAAALGWVFLDEALPLSAIGAILLTVCGIAWAVLERPASAPTDIDSTRRTRGILLAFVGSICQAIGLLLSKQGMGHGWLPTEEHINPQAATLVRMSFAAIGVTPMLILSLRKQRRRRLDGLASDRSGSIGAGLAFTACGAIAGPFLGVWFSLIAADRAPVGIAMTLCSLTPVFILPVVALVYREKISFRAAAGAMIAVAGVILLFL